MSLALYLPRVRSSELLGVTGYEASYEFLRRTHGTRVWIMNATASSFVVDGEVSDAMRHKILNHLPFSMGALGWRLEVAGQPDRDAAAVGTFLVGKTGLSCSLEALTAAEADVREVVARTDRPGRLLFEHRGATRDAECRPTMLFECADQVTPNG
jgi:hypothetical protein